MLILTLQMLFEWSVLYSDVFKLIIIMESRDLFESRFGRNTILFLFNIENTLSSYAISGGFFQWREECLFSGRFLASAGDREMTLEIGSLPLKSGGLESMLIEALKLAKIPDMLLNAIVKLTET